MMSNWTENVKACVSKSKQKSVYVLIHLASFSHEVTTVNEATPECVDLEEGSSIQSADAEGAPDSF